MLPDKNLRQVHFLRTFEFAQKITKFLNCVYEEQNKHRSSLIFNLKNKNKR